MNNYVDLTATFYPAPDCSQRVRVAIDKAASEVNEEAGCIRYEVTSANESEIVLTERWASPEAFEGHRNGLPRKRLNEALDGLLRQPVDLTFA